MQKIKYKINTLCDQPLRKPSIDQPWKKKKKTFTKNLLMTEVINSHATFKSQGKKWRRHGFLLKISIRNGQYAYNILPIEHGGWNLLGLLTYLLRGERGKKEDKQQ